MSSYETELSRQQNSSYALKKWNKQTKKVVDLKEIYKTIYIGICSNQITVREELIEPF